VDRYEINSDQSGRVANVLIVDDDPELTRLLLQVCASKGIRGITAQNKQQALELLEKDPYDLVFISAAIRPRSSSPAHVKCALELLDQIRTSQPELPVVMLAGAHYRELPTNELIEQTVGAIHAGCCDFVIKPVSSEKIEELLDSLVPSRQVNVCDSAEQGMENLYTIVGNSQKLRQTVELALKVAPTTAPVLVSGESGTGKELISYLIHHHSKRRHGPYIRINCAALSESLLESELFGHEKGAFTGAHALRKGRFEMADGGTLLLDEITETPPRFQAKLLRVLEQQVFERVGGNNPIKVNVRIISTTNKNMLQEVAEGRFRQDLYYRLSAVRLVVAPLRERKEDLRDLVWHFVNLYAGQTRRRITRLDPAMMEIFQKYHWPGNVRQLRNVVLTCLIMGTGETLSLADVSWLFDELQPRPQQQSWTERGIGCSQVNLGGIPLVEIEKQAILDTLRQTDGNRTEAAKLLGISDRTLREKIRRYREQQCISLPA